MATSNRKRKPEWPRVRLMLERLEERNLLAAISGPELSCSAYGCEIVMFLGEANDVVTFRYVDATTARLTINGTDYDYARDSVRWLTIWGGPGDDRIEMAPDVIQQGDFIGGPGNDTLVGGASWNELSGDDGNDVLVGGPEWDYLDGGEGNDTLLGGAGDDELWGGLGNDTLRGGAGDDWINAYDNLVYWDCCGNLIAGPPPVSQSQDLILGGDGDDVIEGYSSNDILDGGPGQNQWINPADRLGILIWTSDPWNAWPPGHSDTITLEYVDGNTARVSVNGASFDFERSHFSGIWHIIEGDVYYQNDGVVTIDVVLSNLTDPVVIDVDGVYVKHIRFVPEGHGDASSDNGASFDLARFNLTGFLSSANLAHSAGDLGQPSGNSRDLTDQSEIADSSLAALSGDNQADTFWQGYANPSRLGENGDDTALEGGDLLDPGLANNYLDAGLG